MDDFNNKDYKFTSGENPGQFEPPYEQPLSNYDPYNAPYRPGEPGRQKKKSKSSTVTKRTLSIMVVLCVLLSGAFGFGGTWLANNYFYEPAGSGSGGSSTSSAKGTGFDLQEATGSKLTVKEITEKTQNSVVEIRTESVKADAMMQQFVSQGAGSGVIIKSNGYIVTNNHVISDASKIHVTTKNGKEYDAKLIGTDADTDIAVLKINAKGLSAVTYGNSDQLGVGDMAVAIGNPLGQLGGTVTAGIISALDRSISIDGKTMSLLQTDSSINPGNSGGGLFNQYGQLIGVVVAKSSGSDVEGLGFAIPINRAADVAQQLMDKGYVKGKVTTGMSYVEAADQQSSNDFFGFGEQTTDTSGTKVYIQEVSGKNAKKAGFTAGDMVFSVDGKEIDSIETLSSIITSHKVGDTVEYVISRSGETKTIKLKLAEKTSSQ